MALWLDLPALGLGALWLLTSLGRGPGRDLTAAGRDPRASGPSLWVQRALGAALLLAGAAGLWRR